MPYNSTRKYRRRNVGRYSPFMRRFGSVGRRGTRTRRYGRKMYASSRPSSGMQLGVWRPQGHIPRRKMYIGRMSQFPTCVRVKFVYDCQKNFSLPAGTVDDSDTIDLVPVTPFSPGSVGPPPVGWLQTGALFPAPNYPIGWLTWMQAFARYKTLGCRAEVYATNESNVQDKAYILVTKLMPNTSESTTIGTPQTWIVDPQAKQVFIAQDTTYKANSPNLVLYAKPSDVWGNNNQDWSTNEATMVAQPSRFMYMKLGVLKVNTGNTGNGINMNIRVRLTFYVELFDRKSDLDSGVTPPLAELMARLMPPGSNSYVAVPEPIVDSRMSKRSGSTDRKVPVS